MDVRVGLLFVLVLGASWASDARQLENPALSSRKAGIFDISVIQIHYQEQNSKIQSLKEVSGSDKVCTLCEEYATEALEYISENKTQAEIIVILDVACTRLGSLKRECITLVEYYAPLFFLEVSSVQPEEFCRKVNLCQEIAKKISELKEDSCGLCHRAVAEVVDKLKDPDTQLEVIELLLKACNSMEGYAKKCKRLVFEYGPLILANAEKFLETTDICTTLHACNSSTTNTKEESPMTKTSGLSDS